MIFGLILIIGVIILLAFFIGFNLTNACTIWFFHTYTNLPVYLLALVSFAAGAIFTVFCVLVGKVKSSSSSSDKNPAEKPSKDKTKPDKKKSLLKKAEKAAKNSDNSNDVTKVADTTKLEQK